MIAEVLIEQGVDAIDVAPGKYFPNPARTESHEIDRVRRYWADKGIEIAGMQALLFGTNGLNLFGEPPVQEAMLAHLRAVCRIAAGLGATRLAFGSPKNRDRRGLSDIQAQEVAVRFFQRLGRVAGEHGVNICLEPNPAVYGCNFMTTIEEAARIVRLVGHQCIQLHLDTGALAINGETPEMVVERHHAMIGHVHASEPHLVTLGDGGAPHRDVARALRAFAPQHIVTVEMLASDTEPHTEAVRRALRVARVAYGDQEDDS